jgi:hypothetical protein
MRLLFVLGLFWAVPAFGAPTGASIGINFAPEEPNGGNLGYVEGAAGVAGTVHWNNVEGGATGVADGLVMDVAGASVGTSVDIEWFSNNTWSSDGRGEANNFAPEGNDRSLMLGYLDTTDTSVTEVLIGNLPSQISSGFDVILYTLGGVVNRGGTYTVRTGTGEQSQDNVNRAPFDGNYVGGADGNFLFFEGLTGNSLTIEAMATTTALLRAPLNAIEICATGTCQPRPNPIAGRGTIGDLTVAGTVVNEVLGPAGDPAPGLAQEWFTGANPGNKDAIDGIFNGNSPIVPAFQAGHGATWWTGSDDAFGSLVKYPSEIQPQFNANNNDNYVVRATGEILIPESGTYRFTDGVDDYTYLAIDLNGSGVAGDDPDEVLIDDNAWTNVSRTGNTGGGGYAEVDVTVPAGGRWMAMEFNMGEGGGGDSGVIYWDYDPNAPAGQRLGGQAGFPDIVEDPIDLGDAENMFIPDTHLRSVIRDLISADLEGSVAGASLGFEFDLNATTNTSDRLVIPNPEPGVFTTILDVEGVRFLLTTTGDLQPGDSFQIISADEIVGTPMIISSDPGQTWTFNRTTGQVVFGAGLIGDYNANGVLDAADLDLQAAAMMGGANPAEFDLNGDSLVDINDREQWVNVLRNTFMGDANLDGEFNSSDFVTVFVAGKYETGAAALWAEGDWNGDGVFNSSDFVIAFVGGGYENGPRAGVSAVPEPGSVTLALMGLLGLAGLTRRNRR